MHRKYFAIDSIFRSKASGSLPFLMTKTKRKSTKYSRKEIANIIIIINLRKNYECKKKPMFHNFSGVATLKHAGVYHFLNLNF